MLTYFPAPYPDELWWSVLCRYHVRSGNAKYATTIHELFERRTASLNIYFANAGFYELFNLLPNGLLDIGDIYAKHTLLSYILRFASVKRKQDTWDHIIHGAASAGAKGQLAQWMPKEAYMRYCPICATKDEARYGELYWHCSHQIQAMPLCPYHFCRLQSSKVKVDKTLRQQFIPAMRVNCPDIEPGFSAAHHERALTSTLYSFWQDDLAQADAFWADVLFYELQNQGYFSFTSNKVDTTRLLPEMRQFYGGQFFSRLFDDKWFASTIYRMTITGQFTQPEQYALLAVFLGMDVGRITACKNHNIDIIGERLLDMRQAGFKWSKKRVAEELGVPSHTLDTIARKRNIPIFWATTEKGKSAMGKRKKPQVSIKAFVSEEEKQEYIKRTKELGVASLSEYIKHCIRAEMKGAQP